MPITMLFSSAARAASRFVSSRSPMQIKAATHVNPLAYTKVPPVIYNPGKGFSAPMLPRHAIVSKTKHSGHLGFVPSKIKTAHVNPVKKSTFSGFSRHNRRFLSSDRRAFVGETTVFQPKLFPNPIKSSPVKSSKHKHVDPKYPNFVMKIFGVVLAIFSIFNLWKNSETDNEATTIATDPPSVAAVTTPSSESMEETTVDSITGTLVNENTDKPTVDLITDTHEALDKYSVIKALRLPESEQSEEIKKFVSDLDGQLVPNPAGDWGAPYTPLKKLDIPRYLDQINGESIIYDCYCEWKTKKRRTQGLR